MVLTKYSTRDPSGLLYQPLRKSILLALLNVKQTDAPPFFLTPAAQAEPEGLEKFPARQNFLLLLWQDPENGFHIALGKLEGLRLCPGRRAVLAAASKPRHGEVLGLDSPQPPAVPL
jgi:hypothetical protein